VKLLFFSPYALIDSSSGAALCVSTMLSELVKQGHSCAVVTGSVVDAKNQLFSKILEVKPVTSYKVESTGADLPVRQIDFKGVMHCILGNGCAAEDFRALEEVALRKFFLDGFRQVEPDVMLTYGGFTSNYFAGQYAMSQGRKSVLYAASDSYCHGTEFQLAHVNMIHTVSEAMHQRLAAVTKLPIVTTKTFVRREDVVCENRTPEYITFINPSPSKGLKIAAALVRECHRRGRPYKFLFVEGRGGRERLFAVCPELRGLKNLSIGANTSDVRKVYERTAVCLYPSIYYEAAGRVPIEANVNGIPVLACNNGGIPDMLDGAGFLFEPPEGSRANFMAGVPASYVEPWIETLDRLHADPAFMADAVARAKAADARYSLAPMAKTFAAAMTTR